MRVALPPVRGGLGSGVHGRRGRGEPAAWLRALRRACGTWTVPLPAALALLLLLACIFQYQLYSTLVELDDVASQLRDCSVQLSRGPSSSGLLRQQNVQLTGASHARRNTQADGVAD